MDLIQNQYIDNTVLICGKDESHSKYLELLFENKKRTGGEDMLDFYWDKTLNQYIIVYKKKQTVEDVLNHGNITYNDHKFLPLKVDKNKFIIENIDERLEKDILYLYVENLLQDTFHYKLTIEHLQTNFFLVTCNKPIDFDKLKERFNRHNTIQNRILVLHLVAKLNLSEASFFKQLEYKNLYFGLINQSNRNSPNSSEESNEQVSELNDEGFIEICPKRREGLVLIQDDDNNNTSSGIQQTINPINNNGIMATFRIRMLEDRIKYLEDKLKMYENLKTALVKINSLSQECVNSINRPQGSDSPNTRGLPSLINCYTNDRSESLNNPSSTLNEPINIPSQRRETFDRNSRFKPLQDFKTRLRNLRRSDQRDDELSRLTALNSRLRSNILFESRRNLNDTYEPIRRSEFRMSESPTNLTSSERITRAQLFGTSSSLNITSVSPPNLSFDSDDLNLITTTSPLNSNRRRAHSPSQIVNHDVSSSSRESSPGELNRNVWTLDTLLGFNQFNAMGLSDSMINRFPVIKYKQPKSAFKSLSDKDEASKQTSCLICLEQLVENDDVRLLSCFHQFHVNCIDKWLREKSICPCCKSCLRESLITNY